MSGASKAICSKLQSPPWLLRCLRSRLPLALAVLVWAAPAHAQEALFTSIVNVDSTAADAGEARKAAMKTAERQGLAQLLDKLASDQKDSVLASLDEPAISALVRAIEVVEEKITGSRYRAQLKVNYDALAVNRLLEKRVSAEGIPDQLEHATSVLIIPMYEENESAMLWEGNNTWRAVWERVALEYRGGNLIIPYGDSIDAGALKFTEAMGVTFPQLAQLINRYGVGGVIILKAALRTEPTLSLFVVKRQLTKLTSETFSYEYQADPLEDKGALLLRAARDMAEQIDKQREELLARRAIRSTAETEVMAITPLSTMESWTAVRAMLLSVPSIEKLEVLAVGPKQVDMLLHFKGEKAVLLAALRSTGLTVKEVGNYWIIAHE
ncbi:MAG: DUF2066 domain-containing protein [Alphaproteobacteria bacterium]|nr:DUF2066 domain-containing protein [Alphaproteobacteria bacterium]